MKFSASLLVFSFFIFFSGTLAALPGDLLAADSISARYRTVKAHPVIHRVPAWLQRGVFSNPERHLPALVRFLKRGSRSEFETAKRLHDWITFNIAYDTDLFLGISRNGSRRPYRLLRLRRTVCGGFGRLFEVMGKMAGLEVVYIVAYSKGYWYANRNRLGSHAWNGVKINGKWYIVDTSADSRSSFKHGQFSKKRPYNNTNLFLDPAAKILTNFPYKKEHQFLKRPRELKTWRETPRWQFRYRGFRIRIIRMPEIRKVKVAKEGGRVYRIHDRVIMRRRSVSLEFTSPLRNAVFSVLLKGPDGKYDRTHALVYRENGRVRCIISPPRPGLYTAYLRGRVVGSGRPAGTFWSFQIQSVRNGTALPAFRRFYRNNLGNLYDIRIGKSLFGPGYCCVTISRPSGYSVYADIRDSLFNRSWNKRVINYPGQNTLKYHFTTKGRGPFFLRVYAKKNGTDKWHRQIAVARVLPATRGPQLPREPVYWKRWHEHGLTLLNENVTGEDRPGKVYRVRIRNRSGRKMWCMMYNGKRNRYRKHALMKQSGDRYTFSFTAPGKGYYVAHVYIKGKGRGYNTVLSFAVEVSSKGPQLPLEGQLHFTPLFSASGCRLLSSDLSGKAGYAKVVIRPPAGARIVCGVYRGKEKFRGHCFSQRRGRDFHLYFTRPGSGRYEARIWMKNRGSGYRSLASLALPRSVPGQTLPLRGQLRLYSRFHTEGFRLLTPDDRVRAGRVFRLRVRVPRGMRMTGRLVDSKNRTVRGGCRVVHTGNEYTVMWTLPDGGRYSLRLYRRGGNGRRTIGRIEM